jgi:pimeloyl-ACP methyl ester carboxylesterase
MEPEDRWFNLPHGIRMHARDWGGDGPPVLLLHGLASNARIWDLAAPLLAERARVAALDQRGHGETDKPDEGYDYDAFARDVSAAIESLGFERPVVVGHSWGAAVALDYAARRPDGVRGAVLVDGGVFEISRGMTWEEAEVRMAPPDLTSLTREEFLERMRGWASSIALSPQVEEAVLANFYTAEDGRIRPHLTRENHMKILRAMYDQKVGELYPRVRCPVLIAPAMSAPSADVPAFVQHKRAAVDTALGALPDARVRWFENTVHDIPLHRPAELAAAIESFIDSCA